MISSNTPMPKKLMAKKNSVGHDVILQLIENLPKHQNVNVCFDEWFCSLKLLRETKSMEYLVTVFI